MLYDKYQSRINKVVKARNFVLLHKLPIIIVSAAILLTAGTLVSTKGVVTSASLPDGVSYTYGEKLEYAASSFMGSVTYEFRSEGSSVWSNDEPYKPGKYYVRGASENNFGGHYYSQEATFTITARELTLTLNPVVTYGEKPTLSGDGFLSGDYIEDYSFLYDDISSDNPDPKGSITSLSILNGDGTDVTDCYSYALPTDIEMSVAKREITLVSESASKEYDGSALSAGYTVENLAEGDYIDSTLPSITYPSESGSNTFGDNLVIKNAEGKDVTARYAISSNYGTLTISQKRITLTSKSYTKTYDGKAVEDSYIDLDGSNIVLGEDGSATLESGDTLKVGFDLAGRSLVDADTYTNSFTYSITRDGEDVTSEYYDVTYLPGTITINQRSFDSLKTVALITKAYDGTPFTEEYLLQFISWDDEQLAEGDVAVAAIANKDDLSSDGFIYPSPNSEVPGAYNHYSYTYSLNITRDGEDVTANYVIDESVLTRSVYITEKYIEISSKTGTKVYDGEPFSSEYFQLDVSEPDSDVASDIQSTDSSGSNDGLAEGDTLQTSFTNQNTFMVGTYQNSYTYQIFHGEKDVTYLCYQVYSQSTGTLTIERRPITITTYSASKTYDGEPLSSQYFDYEKESGDRGLVEGDTISVLGYNNITNVDESPAENMPYGVTITRDGVDVTNCYDITYTYGSLEISKAPITVSTDNVSKTYDGTALMTPRDSIHLSGFDEFSAKGYSYAYTASSITNVGETDNIPTISIIDPSGADVTSNFDISFAEDGIGKLSVTPRQVTLSYSGGSGVYDGYQHNYTGLDISNMPDGQYCDWSTSGGPINVTGEGGAVPSEYSTRFYDTYGNDVTSNYEITETTTPGIGVYKRPIYLYVQSPGIVYDDQTHYANYGFIIDSEHYALADGDRISSITYTTSEGVHDAGDSVDVGIASVSIVDEETGEDVTNNYDITTLSGHLYVTQREFSIILNDANKVYDGTPLTAEQAGYEGPYDLVDGHSLNSISISYSGEQTQVGSSQSSATVDAFSILNSSNEDVSKNYSATVWPYDGGTLTVYAATVYSSSSNITKEYDGQTLSDDERGSVTIEGELPSFVDHYVVNWDDSTSGVGYQSNSYSLSFYNAAGEDITTQINSYTSPGTINIYEEYTVSFYNEDGSELVDSKIATSNSLFRYGNNGPDKPETEDYYYTFLGWSETPGGEIANLASGVYLSGDTSYYAVYTEHENVKEISLSIDSQQIEYGDVWDNDCYTLAEGTSLPSGYNIYIDYDLPDGYRPGHYEQCAKVSVYDASGTDVTDDIILNIDSSNDVLDILFPEMTIYIPDYSGVYSGGSGVDRGDYISSGYLPGGYSYDLTCYFDGSYSYVIYDENGKEVDPSIYQDRVTVINGTTNIRNRSMRIRPMNKLFRINEASEATQCVFTSSDLDIQGLGLANGDYISNLAFTYTMDGVAYSKPTLPEDAEPGTYEFTVSISSISIGNRYLGDVTSYYNIRTFTTTLQIVLEA